MNEKEKNHQILNTFQELEYDWNFYGANPFSPSLVQICHELIDGILIQPMVFPTARDSIQLEYEKEEGDYLEFEVYEDRIEVFTMDPQNHTEEYVISHDAHEINRIVSSFFKKKLKKSVDK